MGIVGFAVISRHLNLQIGSALHHMLVSHDVACWIDNKPGAKALQGLTDFAGPSLIVAEELRVKILKWIAHSAPHYPLGVDIHDCRQNFPHRQNRRFRSWISLRE